MAGQGTKEDQTIVDWDIVRQNAIDRLTMQRDDLLEACEAMVAVTVDGNTLDVYPEAEKAWNLTMAAIAKAG